MASTGAQLPFPLQQGGGGLPRYEELKNDEDLVGMEPRHSGAPLRSTVIQVNPAAAAPQVYAVHQPRDHLAWSLFSTLYLNFCCLGFMALVFSIKARDRKVLGDHSGAASYGSTAKSLNIVALLSCILLVIVFVILLASGGIALMNIAKP